MVRKFISMFAVIILTTINLSNVTAVKAGMQIAYKYRPVPQLELVYDDIVATVYHPVREQCDETPLITGDGSRINPHTANNDRWIAVSQDLLYSEYRAKQIKNPNDKRFQGNIQYGDTIWIHSQYEEINGWWVVRDAMNKRYQNKIDFLQSGKNGSIYGIFDDVKIYRIETHNYANLEKYLAI